MGKHEDQLEEFEAELELTLRKEFRTVYPLFRYYVGTQEGIYLCNRLTAEPTTDDAELEIIDIRMEDVWVWDRNRPARIIPRAQIITPAVGLTFEELKEGPDDTGDTVLPFTGFSADEGDTDEPAGE